MNPNLHLVETLDDALELRRWAGERRPVLAIDTETGGLDFWSEPLRLVVLGDTRDGWAIPWHPWAGAALEVLDAYDGPTVFHNAKFDVHFLETNGVRVRRDRLNDTGIAAHLLDPTSRHGLKFLAAQHVDSRSAVGQERLKDGMREHGWTWRTVPVEFPPYWTYAALDGVLTAALWEKFEPEIDAHYRDLYDMEVAVAMLLADMERRGARIDRIYCHTKATELIHFVAETREWVVENYAVNPTSNRQVVERLQADGVTLTKRTDSGAFSVDEEVLAGLDHPLAASVLRIREAQKFEKTYFSKFLELADGDRLHCSINPLGARTGRMSISRPSLQNVPRTAHVRDAFIPSEGGRLVSCDFDQIELRLLAHFAQETSMIEAIRDGVDLHGHTARLVFGDGFTKAHRQIAKGGNFAKVYGAGAAKFGQTVGISEPEAQAFMTRYEAAFPGVATFMRTVEAVAQQRAADEGAAYVKSPAGRRHPLDVRSLYKGVNYLIQGTAADVLKKAILDLDAAGLGEFLVLPVHDEVIADVPEADAAAVAAEIGRVMTDEATYAVPLTASADVVERWGEKYR